MHWTPGFEKQWVDRLRRLDITDVLIEKEAPKLCGMGNVPGVKSIHRMIYERLTENDFKAIAKDYGARYVIEEEPKKLSFEKAYSNGTLCVYKIR
jgi:hypothetical protein